MLFQRSEVEKLDKEQLKIIDLAILPTGGTIYSLECEW
jgi:hypothetical protein